ncbi:MAG: exodeoxyribonuclease VII large subunit [Clostridia bacterium]|nr:exodeoxyribonuclease VII large subunit [Clostridia bacterium]
MELKPITVTELNKYMKDKVATDEFLNNVFIKGEISNFKHHYTGHMYFTLKDENSLIKCIMFKSSTATLKFVPKDGTKVVAYGTVSVYEKDGIYQLYCKSMKEDGIGDLYTAYEELKRKLSLEGLFDEKHKKKIPFMPKIIGVLTSNTGAVIRDIINVSTRRNPNVYIRLFPVPVQGEGAGEKIAEAIEFMNTEKLAEVLIVGRGGGSLEDLWPFNEEIVARAIYNSEIPIISAVGHETDFTIADFVADLRAPTPSAAAELAVTNIEDLENTIILYRNRLKIALRKKTEVMRLRYEKSINSVVFKNPYQKLNDYYILIDRKVKSLENFALQNLKDCKLKATKAITRLDTLSPLKTLTRGYSMVEVDGEVVSSSKDLKKGDMINLLFADGNTKAKVE